MNSQPLKLMLPFLKGVKYENLASPNSMVYGRFSNDFQKDCLLFNVAVKNSMTADDVAYLRTLGFKVCYVYDMLDLENREFTESGFLSINEDIRNAIESGFTHILLSNAYLIELTANEYKDEIQIVLSQQLECNSSRFHVFFEVLNDISSITHVVISQNRLTRARLNELVTLFKKIQLIVEVDRWASDIQMVHEHYYNILYGYYNVYAIDQLRKLSNDKGILQHVKSAADLLHNNQNLMYKIGEINVPAGLYEHNLQAILSKNFNDILIVDLNFWNQNHF